MIRHIGVGVGVGVWFLLSVRLIYADSSTLPIPCSGNLQDFDCALGVFSCDQVSREINEMINNSVERKIKSFYQGVDLDLYKKKDGSDSADRMFEIPVCNLLEGEETQVTSTLHPMPASQSNCGKYTKFEYIQSDTTHGYGTREKAYQQGAYVQAWKCFRNQIFEEIRSKQLKVTNCASVAKEALDLEEMMKKIPKADIEGLCKGKGGKDAQCDSTRASPRPSSSPNVAASEDGSVVTPRMSVCYLAAVQRQIQSLVAQVASCELTERIEASWTKQKVKMSDKIATRIVGACDASIGNSCKTTGLFQFVNISNPACVAEKFTACYERDFATKMKAIIEEIYPDTGACQSNLVLEKERNLC